MPLGNDASDKLNRALVTVLTFYLTTGFNLTHPEITLVAERLDTLLTPLQGRERSHIPIAVVHEMATGQYQTMVDNHAATPTSHHPGLYTATVADWIDMLLRLIGETYQLDPATELALTGELAALLRQLGVNDNGHSRGSHYLPTMIAEILAQRQAASIDPPLTS